MTTRTIMIFPEFDNIDIINTIRMKYDSLANLVNPHITLVFPFESALSNEALKEILKKNLSAIHPFSLTLRGFSKQYGHFGNYLFLNVEEGIKELTEIHDILYQNEFQSFDLGFPYLPHMTVGKFETSSLLDEAFEKIEKINQSFHTVVEKISVEMIGPNEDSIIILEHIL